MELLYSLLKVLIFVLNAIGLLSIIMVVGNIIVVLFNSIKYKENIISTAKANILSYIDSSRLFVLLTCVGLVWTIAHPFLASTTIGGVVEQANYEEYYNVEVYKDYDSLIGTYPALIRCETQEDYDDQRDKTYTYRLYYVDKVFMNGNTVWCDSEGISAGEIKAGQKTSIMDSEIGSFAVRITTSKVDKNAIQFE